MIACNGILIKVARADAQMQRLVAFLLSWTLLEPRTLASQPELYYLLLRIVIGPFATELNDTLHVTAFCSNKPPCYLEILVIINLYVESACVLDVIVLHGRGSNCSSTIHICISRSSHSGCCPRILLLGSIGPSGSKALGLVNVRIAEACGVLLSWGWEQHGTTLAEVLPIGRIGTLVIEIWLLIQVLLVIEILLLHITLLGLLR